jgi:hypothetical protein
MTFGARAAWIDLVDADAIAERSAAVSLCRGVLGGAAVPARSLVAGVGEKATTMVFAAGERPVAFWSVSHERTTQATVRAAEERLSRSDAAALVRAAALAAVERVHLSAFRGLACDVIGASRLARAIVTMGSEGGERAALAQVTDATNLLLARSIESRMRGFPGNWVRAFAVGAAILEAAMLDLGAESIWAPAVMHSGSVRRRGSALART